MNNHIRLMILSVFSLGVMACQGPVSNSYNPALQTTSIKTKFCLVSDDKDTITSLRNNKQISCDPRVIVRSISKEGNVLWWEFINDHEIKTTSVFYPDKYFPWGSKENPHISIDTYKRNGNIFIQTYWDGCKKTFEMAKETSESITFINRGYSSNCNSAILKSQKFNLNQAETYRKVYY